MLYCYSYIDQNGIISAWPVGTFSFTKKLDPHLENFLDPCIEPRHLKYQIWEDKPDFTVY